MKFNGKVIGQVCATVVLLTMVVVKTVVAENTEKIAKKLANPISSLISLPFQFNYDENIGPADDGNRLLVNIQPVIPFALNEDWNVISRTIVPLVYQDDVVADVGNQSGLGDIFQSFFFSPSAPTASGWIWGAGPALLLPTATDDLLGGEKWAAGPTAVALKQSGPWTVGALVNHVWSFAGEDDRGDINASYMQPFIAYTTPSAITFALSSESTYDWEDEEWTVPINANISKVLKFGDQLVSIGGGLRYWAESTVSDPEGLGARFEITFLFPK